MKVQIDTKLKTIKVEESVNLGELAEFLGKIFPKGEWKEFKLETNTIINWSYPVVYNHEPYPTITCDTVSASKGTYNFEVKSSMK